MGQNAAMDRDALLVELKGLHRGRGIRRPGVKSWLGERLWDLLALGPNTTDEDARNALVALLVRQTERFPVDLRWLFHAASGISVDRPFLDERLELAAEKLDRGPRMLRRRLREAEQFLADALIQQYAPTPSRYEARGWQWISHDLDAVIGVEAVIVLQRRLQALADNQKFVHDSVVVANPVPEAEEPEFVPLTGIKGITVARPHPGQWDLTLELPRALPRGAELLTGIQVRWPNSRALVPVMAFVPVRPVHSIDVRVQFRDGVAAQAWVLDGVLPVNALVRPETNPEANLADGVVSASFQQPFLGLTYGVVWRWAE